MPTEIESLDDASQTFNARTLVYDGLVQTDLDMDNHRLLNLDDSNLDFGSAPPTINPPVAEFLHSWNSTTRTWVSRQVRCDWLLPDPSTGGLTLDQQRAIHHLGVINEGLWQGTIVGPSYLPTLSQIRIPLGDVDLGNKKLVNLHAPTDPGDAVNLGYLNNILPGLQVKESVACATTANFNLSGLPMIDGVQTTLSMRVLVKNQTNPAQNGIYRAQTGTWTGHRAPDSDTADELDQAYCFVRGGTTNGETAWVQNNHITTLGTDPLNYVLFSTHGLGPPGPPGPGVPGDGIANQVLAKVSSTPYDTMWVTALYQPLGSVPTGGTPGQVLAKYGAGDYQTMWVTALYAPLGSQLPTGGIANQILAKLDSTDYHCAWVTPTGFAPAQAGMPTGGTAGQLIVKTGSPDYAAAWATPIAVVPSGGIAGQVLTKDTITDFDTSWQTPSPAGGVYAILQTGLLNPAGTTNTTGVMMGLGVGHTFTPFVTGKVIVTVAGYITNSSTGSAAARIYVGAGTPPANGAPIPGTAAAVGASAVRGPIGANDAVPFSLTAAIYPLTVSTPIWIDLVVAASSPGIATVAGVTVSTFEIP